MATPCATAPNKKPRYDHIHSPKSEWRTAEQLEAERRETTDLEIDLFACISERQAIGEIQRPRSKFAKTAKRRIADKARRAKKREQA